MSYNQENRVLFGNVETTLSPRGDLQLQGFCKKLGSDETVTLELFVDEELIATFDATEHYKEIENTYDINGHCFGYTLGAKELLDTHTVAVKDKKSKQHISGSPKRINLNQMRFLRSVATGAKTNSYTKDRIVFLAVEELLDDEQFVSYAKKLLDRFKKISFCALYFSKQQLNMLHNTFEGYADRIDARTPANLEEVAKSAEVFLYSQKNISDRANLAEFDVLYQKIISATDLFTIVLDDNGPALILGSTIAYDQSVVSDIFAGDSNEAMYRFLDLHGGIDTQMLRKIHKKDGFGFVANEINLSNRNFVNYIKKLKQNYPQIQLVAYYFDESLAAKTKEVFADYQNEMKFIQPKDIYELAQDIEVYLHNGLNKDENLTLLKAFITQHSNLFVIDMYGIKSLEPQIRLDVQTQLDFLDSVVAQVFQYDQKFHEYQFLNSSFLIMSNKNHIMTYKKDHISFIGCDETLTNKAFLTYINELVSKFPHYTYTAFFLSRESFLKYKDLLDKNINTKIIDKLDNIISNTEVFIGKSFDDIFCKNIVSYIRQCRNIFYINFNNRLKNKRAKDIILKKDNIIYQNTKYFNVSFQDIKKFNYILPLIQHKPFLISEKIPISLTEDTDMFQFSHYDVLENVLKYEKYKERLNEFRLKTIALKDLEFTYE